MVSAAGPSQRQLRAGELIRHALAGIFLRGETGDPELERLGASVHEVQMSPDLKIATAYVLSYPLDIYPLVGCSTGDEFRANLAASAVKLTLDELAWLDLRGGASLIVRVKVDDASVLQQREIVNQTRQILERLERAVREEGVAV